MSGVLAAGLVSTSPARATDLVSPSYTLRGGHLNAGGSASLASSASLPRFEGSGVAVGQSEAIGWSGSTQDLRTSAPGFWPLLAQGLASLDLDADGLQAFFDADDDDDGLLDAVETNTGVFSSALDTGSNPILADTDGDGADDGIEVQQGFDPNDSNSTPPDPTVPALNWAWRALAASLLLMAALASIRTARPRSA